MIDNPYAPLKILYQDDFLVAIDKPAGLFVHRSFMDKHEIYFALQMLRDQIGQHVYPVHRLDRPTSGVLLFALSSEVARLMGEVFSQRQVKKRYIAITRGHLTGQAVIDYALKEKLDRLGDKQVAIDKEPQGAISEYNSVATATLPVPLGKFPSVRYSLVELAPLTGRRHQLRRHLAHLRHPIIGDINYGDNKQNPFFIKRFGFKRLMLHAKSLSFIHPVTQQNLTIDAPLDEQWQAVFEQLAWQYF